MNSNALAAYLARTLAAELPQLRAVPDGPSTAEPNRPSGSGWSQREELGHLLDSAINNHNRIVRAALDGKFDGPGYEQEGWVAIHRYREIPWLELLEMWLAHNRILLPLIAAIPEERLRAPCMVGAAAPVTLEFLIDDYVLHLQHHIDNVLRRVPPTKYPRE